VKPTPVIFIVAGEPSGDLLGARLMAALRRKDQSVTFAGIGGQHMVAQGLETLFPMSELSLMGLAEILPKLPQIIRRIDQTVSAVLRLRPAALLTIDAPDFSFRVAKRVHRQGIPCIHYVAPSVWAWRPGRAAKIARFLDHLLALFPFEPPYFEAEGLGCSFVGHSAIEDRAGKGDGKGFRARHGIVADQKIVLMLPGSRHGEIDRLLSVFVAALRQVQSTRPAMTIIVPVLPGVAESVRSSVARAELDIRVVTGDEEKFDAFAAADVALTKSGTVTLELALAQVPSVIAYRINPLTHAIARRMAHGRFAGLPNLVLDRPVIPEFLQYQCTPDRLSTEIGNLIDNPAARARQIAGLQQVRALLSVPGKLPSEAAADAVLEVLRERDLHSLHLPD